MKFFLLILLMVSNVMIVNLMAQQSFEATIKIQETNFNGEIIYNNKNSIVYIDNQIKKNIKYQEVLKSIIRKITISEQKYVDKDLFLLDSVHDTQGNIWTISISVTDKGVSVTHFISKQKNKVISGWVNRNNKDIFGLRLFNF